MASDKNEDVGLTGEGWISDDSDFYGNQQVQDDLEKTCDLKDFEQHAKFYERLPANLSYVATRKSAVYLHNRFEGLRDIAWQLGEPISDFVRRLEPSQFNPRNVEWIWIVNPLVSAQEQAAEEDTDGFVSKAARELESFENDKDDIESERVTLSQAAITKKLKPRQLLLEHKLQELAQAHRVMSGKWLLFPKPKQVDRMWRTVAEAVNSGHLGPCAKVSASTTPDATNRGASNTDPETHVICVYTKSFGDVSDVKRVLSGLVDVGLVSKMDTRGIYYKADAYTILGINNKNDYGLKASLYSSKSMLKS